jgi:hypothetical protein
MRTFVFGGSAACAARCQFVSCLEEIDGSCRTYDVQCGYVAQLTADGTYLCFLHAPDEHKGTCAWCDELHAAGSLKACPGCHATWKANGWPDWCCDEMDAPAGEEE